MPIYDYRCEAGHKFTWRQNIKDESLPRCPVEVDIKAIDAKAIARMKDTMDRFRYGTETYWLEHCGAECWRLPSKGISFILKGPGFFRNDYPKGQ